ncbi:hypothetical protein B5F10_13345 [Anaerotruncus colihominis]|uniref:Uncharacterized protein n=1 Tax=Anaerotruncus colihominis TaxID=169435 RepID=A0A1Y4MW07_9FIRM|nr:hypothetical protein B5F11_13635 [Anaerotruncus colihominis]OUP72823.1 hypothetical protein B5F10_13345 [Anaerotruncus colihominis]
MKAGAKALRGLWLPPRAAPFTPGRSPHKKRGPQAARACLDAPPAPCKIHDRRRAAGMDFAGANFYKKRSGENASPARSMEMDGLI